MLRPEVFLQLVRGNTSLIYKTKFSQQSTHIAIFRWRSEFNKLEAVVSCLILRSSVRQSMSDILAGDLTTPLSIQLSMDSLDGLDHLQTDVATLQHPRELVVDGPIHFLLIVLLNPVKDVPRDL